MITMNWIPIGLNWTILFKCLEMTIVVIWRYINKLNWIELLTLKHVLLNISKIKTWRSKELDMGRFHLRSVCLVSAVQLQSEPSVDSNSVLDINQTVTKPYILIPVMKHNLLWNGSCHHVHCILGISCLRLRADVFAHVLESWKKSYLLHIYHCFTQTLNKEKRK